MEVHVPPAAVELLPDAGFFMMADPRMTGSIE
jgi:hypothetical protein